MTDDERDDAPDLGDGPRGEPRVIVQGGKDATVQGDALPPAVILGPPLPGEWEPW